MPTCVNHERVVIKNYIHNEKNTNTIGFFSQCNKTVETKSKD